MVLTVLAACGVTIAVHEAEERQIWIVGTTGVAVAIGNEALNSPPLPPPPTLPKYYVVFSRFR